ncbi:Nucleoside phosphatase [Pseudoloma neurophilia]|uniref:Nucleoside phosphatase n=1 Tax=Pseudoloma neurophilia TaxID=146866 RepID=A0A0R0LU32_9MICR|nr:Nucleoside phosphatase [Pseudoloma neurophilia]
MFWQIFFILTNQILTNAKVGQGNTRIGNLAKNFQSQSSKNNSPTVQGNKLENSENNSPTVQGNKLKNSENNSPTVQGNKLKNSENNSPTVQGTKLENSENNSPTVQEKKLQSSENNSLTVQDNKSPTVKEDQDSISNVIIIDSGYSSNKLNIFTFKNKKLEKSVIKFYPSFKGKNIQGIKHILNEIFFDSEEIILNKKHLEHEKMVYINKFEDIVDEQNTIQRRIQAIKRNASENIILNNTKLAFVGTEGLRFLFTDKISWQKLHTLLNQMLKDTQYTVYKPIILSGVNEGLYAFESLLYLLSQKEEEDRETCIRQGPLCDQTIKTKSSDSYLYESDSILDLYDTTEFTNELYNKLLENKPEKAFVYPIKELRNSSENLSVIKNNTVYDIKPEIKSGNESNMTPEMKSDIQSNMDYTASYIRPSTGILEMGGGSLQITFSITLNNQPIVISRSFDNLGMQKGKEVFLKYFGYNRILPKKVHFEEKSEIERNLSPQEESWHTKVADYTKFKHSSLLEERILNISEKPSCTDFNRDCINDFQNVFKITLFTMAAPVYLVNDFYLVSYYFDVLNQYKDIRRISDIVEKFNQNCIYNIHEGKFFAKNIKLYENQTVEEAHRNHCTDLSYIIFTLKALNVSEFTNLMISRSIGGFNLTWGVSKAWELNNE